MDERMRKAQERMMLRGPDEIVLQDGQMNDDPNPMARYPAMLYRKTDIEQRVQQTDDGAKCGATFLVTNRFDGLLCDTMIASDADHAEALASEGWDTSPKAAYGIEDGLVAAVSSKDAEIAELKAQLAAANKPRLGRPPKDAGAEIQPTLAE